MTKPLIPCPASWHVRPAAPYAPVPGVNAGGVASVQESEHDDDGGGSKGGGDGGGGGGDGGGGGGAFGGAEVQHGGSA